MRIRSAASWLDVKLAARMLFKQPGLTGVAIFALAIGIPVGLLPLHVLSSLTKPLPVQKGAEIVVVRNYDRAAARPIERPLHDFAIWQKELSSFEGLGAWRSDLYNVAGSDGRVAQLQGSEVTASIFSLLRVKPLMGRLLNVEDEVIGVPDVVVIAHDVWQSRLGGDPQVIGSTIRVGGVPHTIVGVMPREFLFPVRDFLWLPFRYNALAYAPGAGPSATIVGRLADGITLEAARREIEFVGKRMATQFPATHAQFRPQVLPYTSVLTGMDSPDAKVSVAVTQILAFLLLALACGNVGILTLARAAVRTREIAIRTAIGASRLRIVSQLFIESLLLAASAAGLGLLILQAVARGPDYLLNGLPFWVDFDVSPKTAGLALSLAIVSAAIAGVVPAFEATGTRVLVSIQRAGADGSGIRFGKGYSTLIIGEVAVSVVLLALLGSALLPTVLSKPGALGIATDQYLYASIRIPRADAAPGSLARTHRELVRRLAAEPGVGKVAIASSLPGLSHETRYIQIEGLARAAGAPAPAWPVNTARVDVGYFDALEQPVLSGRSFNRADLGADRSAIIVNQSFVARVLGGRNPLGRRVRYWEAGVEPGPWSYEIVGVVGSLGMNALAAERDEGLYQVAAPGELHPLRFALRVPGDPERFAPRLYSIVSSIDPSVLLQDPVLLSDMPNPDRRVVTLTTYLFALLAGIAVVLAAACLYALMSFTVTERTRECGIRTALGARPARIVSTIGRRAFVQLSTGVLLGGILSALVLAQSAGRNSTLVPVANWPITVSVIALGVVFVGLLACARPTLRLLRIQPLEALKS